MKVDIRVADILKSDVLAVSPTDSVLSAIAKMKAREIGSAIVVEGPEIIGIMTERDVAFKLVPARMDPERTSVREIMTSPVVSVRASTDLTEAADLMKKNGFRRLPVVDESGKLVGIVTEKDFADVQPDIIRLLQTLLDANEKKGEGDSISEYHKEKAAREQLKRIKNRGAVR